MRRSTGGGAIVHDRPDRALENSGLINELEDRDLKALLHDYYRTVERIANRLGYIVGQNFGWVFDVEAKMVRLDAELLEDGGAETEDAHLHALHRFHARDFLAEPARRFRRDAEHVERDHAIRLVEFVTKLVAVAVLLPGLEFTEARAEWHGGEERHGLAKLAGVIAGRRPARFDRALGGCVEALKGGNEGTRLLQLDL